MTFSGVLVSYWESSKTFPEKSQEKKSSDFSKIKSLLGILYARITKMLQSKGVHTKSVYTKSVYTKSMYTKSMNTKSTKKQVYKVQKFSQENTEQFINNTGQKKQQSTSLNSIESCYWVKVVTS